MTAPKIVEGSITNMRSQSISGFLMKECLLPMLNSRLAKAPPTIVKFESATAYLAAKPESMITPNQDRRSAEPNDKCLHVANSTTKTWQVNVTVYRLTVSTVRRSEVVADLGCLQRAAPGYHLHQSRLLPL